MKKIKRKSMAITLCLSLLLTFGMQPTMAFADSTKVVTLGADLSDKQKEMMWKTFGTSETQVELVTVTNAQEKEMLSGVMSAADIGKRTYSCAYICPTEEGSGIRVQLANIKKVTSNMIASALTTAGIYNCDVIAAAPMEVSGTGALTGILVAFDKVSDTTITDEQKKLATEEMVTTNELVGELQEEIAEEKGVSKEEAKQEADNKATGMINEIKAQVIADNITSTGDITNIVNEVSNRYDVNLNQTQINNIVTVMEGISKQDYDMDQMATTINSITTNATKDLGIEVSKKVADITGKFTNASEEATGFFASVGNFFKGIGTAIANFFKGIGNWFGGLFGHSSNESGNATSTTSEPTATSNSGGDSSLEGGSGIFDNLNIDALKTDKDKDIVVDQTDVIQVQP